MSHKRGVGNRDSKQSIVFGKGGRIKIGAILLTEQENSYDRIQDVIDWEK